MEIRFDLLNPDAKVQRKPKTAKKKSLRNVTFNSC